MLYPPVVPDLRIEEHGRIGELARGRTALVTVAVVLALAPLPVHGQEVESVEGGRRLGRCPPACGRDLRIAPALNAYALIPGETGLDPRIDTGSHNLPRREQSRGRLPSPTDRSRSREEGRRARREQQESVETVKVSQAPAVSEAPSGATPIAEGASLATLPSAVQDFARFFLSLSG